MSISLASLVPTPSPAPQAGTRLAARLAELRGLEPMLLAVERAREPVLTALGVFVVVVLVLSLAAVLASHRSPWGSLLRVLARLLLPLALAISAASILMFAVAPRPDSVGAAIAAFAVCALAVWAAGLGVARAAGVRWGAVVLCAATAVPVLLDQWLGGIWSYTGFITYTPLRGVRYYGMGNEGAAVLVASAIIGVALAADALAPSALAGTLRRWGVAVAGVAVVLTAAAPTLGANVTVVVWGSLAFGVFWALANGHRLRWAHALAALGAIALAVAAFVTLDVAAGSQTHVADAWRALASGNLGALVGLVSSKVSISARIFGYSPGAWVGVAVVAGLAYARWRRPRAAAAVFDASPSFAAGVWAILAGALAGMLTEDSGVVLVTLLALPPAEVLLWLALDPAEGRARRSNPGEGAAT